MSARPYLTKRQKEFLRLKFEDFKKDETLTASRIARDMGIDKTTVAKYFKKIFGDEYSRTSKNKCGWNRKLSEEQIKEIFLEYKNGISIMELSKRYGMVRDSITHRMQKVIGKEYSELAAIRRFEDSGRKRLKVSDSKIKDLFEIYKSSNYSLTELAEKVCIAESSLISRFKKLFRKEYRRIAITRRDERKVTKKEYIEAFGRYKNTNISLTQLASMLNIRISSLASRFKKMFGLEYYKIADRKSDSIEIDRSGKLAENLASEYLKLCGIKFMDVRNKAVLKGSLKRPDFLVDGGFVEVKNNYIKISGFGKIKGYREIKDSYFKKITKDGKSIEGGTIISFCGFSPEVLKNAEIDKITLIGPKELEMKFESEKRNDLLSQLKILRGV